MDEYVSKKLKIVLPIIVLCAYSCSFVYFNNIGEGKFSEIIIPFLIFCGIGIMLQILFGVIFRDGEKASVFTCLLLIMVTNFYFVVRLIRQKYGNDIRPLYVTLGWLAIYIIIFLIFLKIKAGEAWLYMCNIISLVFTCLIIFNGISAIPDMISLETGKNIQKLELVERGNQDKAGKNVYYMIFDEYGGTENLKYYYNFDNQEFERYLRDKGFSYSHSSYNREACKTTKIVPNLLNLNYVTSNDENRNREYMKEPILYRYFRDMGYQINLVSHQNFLSGEGCNNLLEQQKAIGTDVNFTDYLYEQSIINIILRNLIPGNSYHERYVESLTDAIEGMKSVWKEAKANGGKTLTICYLQCPHPFFVYDKDGKILSKDDEANWENKDIYIGQLKYLNECIKVSIDEILENDPEAVIILQSDHGARSASPYESTLDGVWDAGVDYRQNVLNCVYWGSGVELQDIEGLSGINTLRLVLNIEFGSNFDMISVPIDYNGEGRENE